MPAPELQRWISPSVILVATDLSDLERLMPFAMEEAHRTGARLILFHVVTASAMVSSDAAGLPYYDTAGILEFADRSLRPWCEMARRENLVCDALVREGHPAQQVTAAVRQFRVDRVLLGTRSRGKLSKLLLGSVAEQVLRSVNIPVMTVGPEAHLPVASGAEGVVLHATTLRETSRPSAALACQIAAQFKAKLVLLHVLPPVDEMEQRGIPSGLDATALHLLDRLAAEAGSGAGVDIEPCVIHGNPSIEILAEASQRKASLIVLGATHRSVFENLTRDRTVYRVLAHARCPVLTLREAAAAAVEYSAEASVLTH
jgi:nucleotide-binding universal stress UspA family protein